MRNIFLKVIKGIITIFASLFFCTIPKILNMANFIIVFRVIHHKVMFSINCFNDKLFNLIFLNQKKKPSTKF